MVKRNEIFYRLHRLAEAGYCAELGRYPTERSVVRMFHPANSASQISMHDDGSLHCFAFPMDHDFSCISVDDVEIFERFIKETKLRMGWRSLYVNEVQTRVLGGLLFNIPAVAVMLFAYWWWTRS